MKREVEATWATERMENAVLRERINDVAAEVARLTSVLEGPGSPIDTMLAGDAARHGAAGAGAAAAGAPTSATAKAPAARSPTACGRCKAAPRRCRSRAAPDMPLGADGASRGVNGSHSQRLTQAAACLKSCPRTGRLAQRESVPFTRERS